MRLSFVGYAVSRRRVAGQCGVDQAACSIGRLPLQVRQGGGEVDGVLAGAAADFEDAVASGEVLADYSADGHGCRVSA